MLKRGADLVSNVQVCIILRSRRQRLGRSHVFWGPRGDEEWNPRWGVPDCRDHVANQDALLALCIRLAGTLPTISQHGESRRTLSIQAPTPVLTVNTTGMGGGGWEGTRHHTPGAAWPFNHNRFRSVLVVSLRGGEAEYLQILPSSFSYIRGREENPMFAETAHSVCCNG